MANGNRRISLIYCRNTYWNSKKLVLVLHFVILKWFFYYGTAGFYVTSIFDTFTIKGNKFLLDNQPFQFLCGEMHYQRIPHEHWRQRLQMARALGLNSVAIYMFWNWHEPEKGKFDFTGKNDVAKFVKIAQEEDLLVLIRPGPYCCAEWDFGGFPYWLLKDGNARLRCLDEVYMGHVKEYIAAWSKELAPLQVHKGGPILMVQVENEYGSYGSDADYLWAVHEILRENSWDVPLFTCDGSSLDYLRRGTHPDILPCVNMGGLPQGQFKTLEKFRPNIPHIVTEYYTGWFVHWGNLTVIKTTAAKVAITVKALKWMIENDKGFNFYMVHGGTNFGFSAGANWFGSHKPDITSYDYGAPIDEAGRNTIQYDGIRKLLTQYQGDLRLNPVGNPIPAIPSKPKLIEIPAFELEKSISLFDCLPKPLTEGQVRNMEYYGQDFGAILYRTQVTVEFANKDFRIRELHDYAYVFVGNLHHPDGPKRELIAVLDRSRQQEHFKMVNRAKFKHYNCTPRLFEGEKGDVIDLEILVEAHGRVNYGAGIMDRKGITEYVASGERFILMNWEVFCLPLGKTYLEDHITQPLNERGITEKNQLTPMRSAGIPLVHKGIFDLNSSDLGKNGVPGDTFLHLGKYKKGIVYVNGYNLGRFWDIGPTYALYCPGPWLKEKGNEIVIVDFLGVSAGKDTKIKKIFRKLRTLSKGGNKKDTTPKIVRNSGDPRPPIKSVNTHA